MTILDRRPGEGTTLGLFENAGRRRLDALLLWEKTRELPGDEDILGHWVLKMAMCLTRQARKRVTDFEAAVFLQSGDQESIAAEMGFEKVAGGYVVHWTRVTDLVRDRRVVIKGGQAHVPPDLVSFITVGMFRRKMDVQLKAAKRNYQSIDERVGNVLSVIQKLAEKTYGSLKVAIDIDKAAPKNFPMCMRSMHAFLDKNGYLKHEGRRQFQLFVKGAGVEFGDSLGYFRTKYTRDFSQYEYGLRHSYGLVGSKTDYQPYSCTAIIRKSNATAGQAHGCPFVGNEFDIEDLGVVGLARAGHPQAACRSHFELEHPGKEAGGVGNHPNEWLKRSLTSF